LSRLLIIWWALSSIGPWLLNSVWTANSLAECRAILDGATGACFSVITNRWHQLLFGFYPPEHYWRPVLTLVLLFVALAPVLFPGPAAQDAGALVRYTRLWATICFGAGRCGFRSLLRWALWRGIVAYKLLSKLNNLLAIFGAILGPVLWWMFVAGQIDSALSAAMPLGLEFVRSDRFGGFLISLIIGISGISLSLPIGILLALGRQSDMVFLKTVCVVVIEFIRGVP
jgi:general L-amino acid transport system permease protein